MVFAMVVANGMNGGIVAQFGMENCNICQGTAVGIIGTDAVVERTGSPLIDAIGLKTINGDMVGMGQTPDIFSLTLFTITDTISITNAIPSERSRSGCGLRTDKLGGFGTIGIAETDRISRERDIGNREGHVACAVGEIGIRRRGG